MNIVIKQIFKFAFVGGFSFVIDYGIMVILTEFVGMHYLISCCLSFIISVIANYFLSIHWIFKEKNKYNKLLEFIVFIFLSVIGLGINQIIMWIVVEYCFIPYFIAKIVATAVVMIYNFISRKRFFENHIILFQK